MRHEAEIKSNGYWLGLLAHLQASSVPRKVTRNFLSISSNFSEITDILMENKYWIEFFFVTLLMLKLSL